MGTLSGFGGLTGTQEMCFMVGNKWKTLQIVSTNMAELGLSVPCFCLKTKNVMASVYKHSRIVCSQAPNMKYRTKITRHEETQKIYMYKK